VHEVDIILVFTQYRERGGLGGRGDFPPPGKLGGRSPLEKLGAQEEPPLPGKYHKPPLFMEYQETWDNFKPSCKIVM